MYVAVSDVCAGVDLGTIFCCRWWRPTMMWSAISRGGREVMILHALNRDTLINVISGAKGASQHQAANLAARRVYAAARVR